MNGTITRPRFSLRKQSFADFLLSHGYDPNERYSSGSDALTEALALALPTSVITLLLAHGFDTQATPTKALHVAAAESSSLNTMAVLLEAGVPINALAERLERRNVSRMANPYRATPLHFAAEAGQTENVRFLLEHGAALDVKDSVGKYPSQRVPNACTDCAELLAQSPSG
jgi:ankyrin repeat protein